MGRHSTFESKYCEDLIDHMKQGLCIDSFPAVLHEKYGIYIARQTLYKWAHQHDDFGDSKKAGDAYSLRVWKKLLLKALATNKQIASGAWVFVMKNRFGYRDLPLEETPDDRPTLSDLMKKIEARNEKETQDGMLNSPKAPSRKIEPLPGKSKNTKHRGKKKTKKTN